MYAYLIYAVLAGLFLSVGIRLFQLGRRTGEVPDRTLGVTFLMWGASYTLWALEYFADLFLTSVDAPDVAWETYYFVANAVSAAGTFGIALFLRAVFRDRESWARWLVISDGVLLATALVGSCFYGDAGLYQPLHNPFYALSSIGATLPMAWMLVEGSVQSVRARKRERLGLCSPVVCNRYLLIALASACWVAYYPLLILADAMYEQTGAWPDSLGTSLLLLEISAVVMFSLVFLPPEAYRRWLMGRGATRTPGAAR